MPSEPSAGVAAGVLAILVIFWNVPVVLLGGFVVVAGALDIWTGSRRARINQRLGRGAFDRARLDDGVSGKAAALVAILFLGIAGDSVIHMLGGLPLDTLGVPEVVGPQTPVLLTLLAFRLAREASSIVENIEETPGGRGTFWPGFAYLVDTVRAKMSGNGRADSRWTDRLDQLTPEQRTALRRWFDSLEEPPPPEAGGPRT